MSKWARMTHLDTSHTSYGQKKCHESNWQFDSWSLKVRNRLDFLAWRWRATYHWKALEEGYNFASDLIPIVGFHTKLQESQLWEFREFWEYRDKMTFGCWSHGQAQSILWGEGGGFPQVRVVVSLVSLWLPMAHPCIKVLQLHTNQLVVWFV
jgi:hypothetical protein